MKAILFLLATIITIHLPAQTRINYGLFKKSDGSKIKGTIMIKGFEDQVSITSFTGGSDNSGTIEIEVPMGAYVAEFRNMMNATNAAASKQVVATLPGKVVVPAANANIGDKMTQTIQRPSLQPQIARAEISIVDNNPPQISFRIANKIVLEDIRVESCTDDAASGKTRIKLKGSRIGWVYYTYDAKTGARSSSQSGWNVAAGQAWNSF